MHSYTSDKTGQRRSFIDAPVSRADTCEIIASLQAAGIDWYVPLYRAIGAGRIQLAFWADRDAPLPRKRLSKCGRTPVLFLIGDDDYRSTGPAGWRCAAPAAEWAAASVVHGAAGDAEIYQSVVTATERWRRLLLVETSGDHVPAWSRIVSGKPCLLINPIGGLHPIAPSKVGLQ